MDPTMRAVLVGIAVCLGLFLGYRGYRYSQALGDCDTVYSCTQERKEVLASCQEARQRCRSEVRFFPGL